MPVRGSKTACKDVEIRSKFPPSVEGIRALKRAVHSHVKSCRVDDNLTDDRPTMLHRICRKDTTDGWHKPKQKNVCKSGVQCYETSDMLSASSSLFWSMQVQPI